MVTKTFQAIIIGSGQGGGPLASALADAGWSVALVEKEHVGGTCINEGCTPTKTMVASARVAYLARRALDYGVHAGPISVNMRDVRERKRKVVESFREGSLKRLEETDGLELIFGEARFSGDKTLTVTSPAGDRTLSAQTIIINVGARPTIPNLLGLDEVRYLTSTSIMELDSLPEHLLVLGGGYVGLEFAQMFRRFGGKVTVIQRASQLAPREDPDIAEELREIFQQDEIRVLLKCDAVRVTQDGRGKLELSVKSPQGEETLIGSHLLVATGRTPNTDMLNLEVTGVTTDARGYIQVNELLETRVPGTYAIGDVKGGPAFTHISYDDYRVLKANLLAGQARRITGRLVPYTLFTDPQLGRVGLTETQAREQGFTIKVAKLPMSSVARAIETGETRGLMKAIVNADDDRILGAAILGVDGGEVVGALQMAMMGHLPYTAIRDGVFAHPTLVESLNNLFMTLD